MVSVYRYFQNKMRLNNNQKAFFAFVRAGLWGGQKSVQELIAQEFKDADWNEVYQLAQEQSVQGLALQGIEALRNLNGSPNLTIPQGLLLQWIGEVQIIEQRNKEMNAFVAELIDRLRKEDIYCILVKGQGVAQCYEKPLWRCSGDIDLLLSNENYKKAKSALIPIASEVADEDKTTKHQALVINGFDVELHGKMPFTISKRVEAEIDEVLNDVFCGGNVKSWDCNRTQVFLPSPDNDVILVFTHFLHHFFIEGVGLRQICDWCRLLYTYRGTLKYRLLESRIKAMGLMSEWKAFASLAVDILGMPIDAMPFYDKRFKRKGEKVLELILEAGNFGHNKDLSYRVKYKGFTYKIVSLWRRFCDFCDFATIFPKDSPLFFITYVTGKVK